MSKLLKQALEQNEQAIREIYYALKQLPKGHPARANLVLALDYLGSLGPESVGLSKTVQYYSDTE